MVGVYAMSHEGREKVAITTNVLQTIVLLIAIGAVMLQMGRRDQQLELTAKAVETLREITTDLAKTQINLTVNTDHLSAKVADLTSRLRQLETTR
jgi:cytochrome c biogenesis factor